MCGTILYTVSAQEEEARRLWQAELTGHAEKLCGAYFG